MSDQLRELNDRLERALTSLDDLIVDSTKRTGPFSSETQRLKAKREGVELGRIYVQDYTQLVQAGSDTSEESGHAGSSDVPVKPLQADETLVQGRP